MSQLANAIAALKEQNDHLTREKQRLALQLTAATERAERAERQLAEAGKAWHEQGAYGAKILDKLPKPEGT